MSTTLSSLQFDQDPAGAQKAAEQGPVIIIDGELPSHMLLSFDAYQKLIGKHRSLLDALAMPGGEDIEFDPPRMGDKIFKSVDFD